MTVWLVCMMVSSLPYMMVLVSCKMVLGLYMKAWELYMRASAPHRKVLVPHRKVLEPHMRAWACRRVSAFHLLHLHGQG